MPQSTCNLNNAAIIPLAPDQELSIKPKRKNNYGRFQAIGEITNMYDMKPKNTDLFTMLTLLSHGTLLVFEDLKNNRDSANNHTCSPTTGLTKNQIRVINRDISQLKKLGIIKKIHKRSFMFNPSLIMCYDQDVAVNEWSTLP